MAYDFIPSRTLSMEKLLSAAIAYLMILKSEVSFLSRARNLLTM
jgi:hypothetical protein